MSKPAELLTYDFLAEAKAGANAIAALTADEQTLLSGITIHDTVYQNFAKGQDFGVRIGETPSDFSPGPGGIISEWDAEVPLAIFARVAGAEKTNRAASLQKVFELSKIIARIFNLNPTMSDRICASSYLTRWTRGFDEMDGEAYAVSNTSLIANPSGEMSFNK